MYNQFHLCCGRCLPNGLTLGRSSKQASQTQQPKGAGKASEGRGESRGAGSGDPGESRGAGGLLLGLAGGQRGRAWGPVPPDLVTFQRHFKNPHGFIVFPNLHVSVPFHLCKTRASRPRLRMAPNRRLRQEETEAVTPSQRRPSSQALPGRCFAASAWRVKKRGP